MTDIKRVEDLDPEQLIDAGVEAMRREVVRANVESKRLSGELGFVLREAGGKMPVGVALALMALWTGVGIYIGSVL